MAGKNKRAHDQAPRSHPGPPTPLPNLTSGGPLPYVSKRRTLARAAGLALAWADRARTRERRGGGVLVVSLGPCSTAAALPTSSARLLPSGLPTRPLPPPPPLQVRAIGGVWCARARRQSTPNLDGGLVSRATGPHDFCLVRRSHVCARNARARYARRWKRKRGRRSTEAPRSGRVDRRGRRCEGLSAPTHAPPTYGVGWRLAAQEEASGAHAAWTPPAAALTRQRPSR